jgi:hypothetical protein
MDETHVDFSCWTFGSLAVIEDDTKGIGVIFVFGRSLTSVLVNDYCIIYTHKTSSAGPRRNSRDKSMLVFWETINSYFDSFVTGRPITNYWYVHK